MNTSNKAPQAKIIHQMVDITNLYSPSELAECLEVSRTHIYDMINSGLIPSKNVFIKKNYTLILWEDDFDMEKYKRKFTATKKLIPQEKLNGYF